MLGYSVFAVVDDFAAGILVLLILDPENGYFGVYHVIAAVFNILVLSATVSVSMTDTIGIYHGFRYNTDTVLTADAIYAHVVAVE